MEAKHTEGPWEISHEPPRWVIQAERPIGKKAVAFMVGDYVECAANARLIAAAPDLLAALEPFAARAMQPGFDNADDAETVTFFVKDVRDAAAAIAKATA